MKTLLVTGGSGYLGRSLTARAVDRFQIHTTYHTHRQEVKAGQALPLNLADRHEVLRLITDLAPQAIIHTAAINPGRGSAAEMLTINGNGSRYIAEAAAAVGARLVHLSSDVVHNGRNAPYTDDAPPSPINDYGRSKAMAEAAISEVYPQAAMVRTSLIYGLHEMDRSTAGFVKHFQAGQPLLLFNDVMRQPVWVETLAEALLRLVALDFAGPLNVAGRQALTREVYGRRMLAWWRIDAGGLLRSGRAADISDTIPLDLRLSISKAEALLGMTFPSVDEVLAQGH